ncbi:glycosyltransferase family 20 protein, partial [Mitosporidium daphniae]
MDRLLVVSNRLPVTLSRENGAWTYKRSSGGLVAGLAGMKKMTSFIWIGWPGLSHIDLIFLGFEIPEEDRDQIGETLLSEYSAIPVFLPDEISNPFYNTFANSILWPLFHYLPVDMSFDESAWEAYVKANSLFADVILKECRDNDLVWIHDYQLMTLPRLLRMKLDLSGFKNVKIGFFHHIPFPSSEVFRVLPVGACILKGIIAADLIGFHTYEYGRHFLSSCNRLLSLATSPTMVRVSDGHIARVGIYPIGIDPDPFIDALDLP